MSAQAEQYLADHNIHGIMEYLCAQLVYSKPADPVSFLAGELRKLQSKKGSGSSTTGVPSSALSLFTEADFDVMFQMMDPHNKGTLTSRQVHKAINDLGLDQTKAKVDPTVEQNYNLESFRKICIMAQ